MMAARPGMPAIAEIPAIPAAPAIPALKDAAGNEIPGTARPALPGRAGRPGRAAVPPTGAQTCKFESDGDYTAAPGFEEAALWEDMEEEEEFLFNELEDFLV